MGNVLRNVSEAARFLDVQVAGWENIVDVEALDMTQYSKCVLGQLFKGHVPPDGNPYIHGIRTLDISRPDIFCANTPDWKQEILTRRNKAARNQAIADATPELKLARMESELQEKLKRIKTLKELKEQLKDYNEMVERYKGYAVTTHAAISKLNEELGLS